MPPELSQELVARMREWGKAAVYTWDWGLNGRVGTWAPDGEVTHINRYSLDFQRMVQTNVDNGSARTFRIIYILDQRPDLVLR